MGRGATQVTVAMRLKGEPGPSPSPEGLARCLSGHWGLDCRLGQDGRCPRCSQPPPWAD